MTSSPITSTESAHDYQLLIKQLFLHPVVDAPEQEIVYRLNMRYNYRRFRERVRCLAAALTRMGVKPGDTVAVMDWDSHRYLECFFAVPMIGAVLHTINVRFTPEQILFTIDHAEDDVLLINSEFVPILEQIRGRIDTVRDFILIKDDDYHLHESAFSFTAEYEEMLASAPPIFDFPDFNENIRATTFYTTGTTGMPKGVFFSHRQLVLHTLAVQTTLCSSISQGRLHRGDVYMPITPMFHVHAWGMPYVATSLGLKQVYPGRYAPDMLLKLVELEKVTFSHCVPTILRMLLNHPHANKIDLNGWKLIIGGAAMSRALCIEALGRGLDIFTGYGMSETCPILTISQLTPEMLELGHEEQAEIRCKTGLALPLVDLIVAGEGCKEMPRDDSSAGEIIVRAPWLTQGYLKDRKISEKLWEDGYLHTGDLAVRDERGYVKITDRSKDVIKVGGEWISSLELEDIIAHHPFVAEVAVIGLPDEKWGERPLALVVPKPGSVIAEKQIQHYVREYADKGMISKQIVLLKVWQVDALHKTSVGKTNKVALRERYVV
jgi:fatty-acyl-CoA synthase